MSVIKLQIENFLGIKVCNFLNSLAAEPPPSIFYIKSYMG